MIIIFTGPTISPEECQSILNEYYFPPVAQGDIYRAALLNPKAIGIIDGYFERIPSVWHKEILWAMKKGIHVYGSSSMGALRAAELTQFGMVGVGKIFDDFLDGELEDDDEVALLHGTAEVNYIGITVPMVNIRATLKKAEDLKIISPGTRKKLIEIGKNTFYGERNYKDIFEKGLKKGIPKTELRVLSNWVPKNKVDQKREDAILMLEKLKKDFQDHNFLPKQVNYELEHTEWWDGLQRRAGQFQLEKSGIVRTLKTDSLLDEIRLTDSAFYRIHHGTMLWHFAVEEAKRQAWDVEEKIIIQKAEEFLNGLELTEEEKRNDWLLSNDLSYESFYELIKENILVEIVLNRMYPVFMQKVANHLRLKNKYIRYNTRAKEKQKLLEENWLENASYEAAGIPEKKILEWYFRGRNKPKPENLGTYAQSLGFADENAFKRALVREHIFLKLNDKN